LIILVNEYILFRHQFKSNIVVIYSAIEHAIREQLGTRFLRHS